MNVRELIERLKAFPPDMPVIFFNECADDDIRSVNVDHVEIQTHQNWIHAPDGMPVKCAVLS